MKYVRPKSIMKTNIIDLFKIVKSSVFEYNKYTYIILYIDKPINNDEYSLKGKFQ